MKTTVSLLVICLSTQLAFGQNEHNMEGKRAEIKSQKIGFLTRELELTPDEAQKFWPVYNEFEQKMEDIRLDRKQTMQEARANFPNLSDEEALKLADENIAFEQKQLDVKKQYHSRFKEILPGKKIARLYHAEDKFKRELLKKMRENRHRKPKGIGGSHR